MPIKSVFSKVNAHKVSSRRNKHNLGHEVVTSQDFGSCQPYFSKLLKPGSSVDYSMDEKIRVMPMALPPFGSAKHHVFAQFVPLHDIWKPAPSFFSRTSYASFFGNYTPDRLPSVNTGFVNLSAKTFDGSQPSLVSLLCSPALSSTAVYIVNGSSTLENLMFLNYDSNNPSREGVSINSLASDGTTGFDSHTVLLASLNATFRDLFPSSSTFTFEPGAAATSHNFYRPFNIFSYINVKLSSSSPSYLRIPSTWNYNNTVGLAAFKDKLSSEGENVNIFNTTFESSDFRFLVPIVSAGLDASYLFCVKLNARGRRVANILRGLGYSLNTVSSKPQSLLPLFAYYKAWFDTFYPKRDITWAQTRCAQLIEQISDLGVVNISDMNSNIFQSADVSDLSIQLLFYRFLCEDVADMFATADPDYFTSSITTLNPSDADLSLSSPLTGEGSLSDMGYQGTVENFSVPSKSAKTTDSASPLLSTTYGYISAVGLRVVQKFSRFLGTNTILGKSVNKIMKAHFGESFNFESESNFVGASVVPVEFSDVITTADTSEGSTGDYSGVGFGAGKVHFKYSIPKDCQDFGYFLVFGSIIPTQNYMQGCQSDNFRLTYTEMPQKEFDSLGYESVYDGELFNSLTFGDRDRSSTSFADSFYNASAPFGYQPRYLSHKVHQSLFNGDFANPSSFKSYLGFTFSNFITQDYTGYIDDSGDGVSVGGIRWRSSISNPALSEFVSSTSWRWLGKYAWRTNFSRIFKDRTIAHTGSGVYPSFVYNGVLPSYMQDLVPLFDPFIIYMGVGVDMYNDLEPVSQSYEAIEGDDNYVVHE